MRDLVSIIRQELAIVMSGLGVEESKWSTLLAAATDTAHGDVAMPCHSLAGILKKSPSIIADEIAVAISSKIGDFVTVGSINGFLNFTATQNWLEQTISIVAADDNFCIEIEDESDWFDGECDEDEDTARKLYRDNRFVKLTKNSVHLGVCLLRRLGRHNSHQTGLSRCSSCPDRSRKKSSEG